MAALSGLGLAILESTGADSRWIRQLMSNPDYAHSRGELIKSSGLPRPQSVANKELKGLGNFFESNPDYHAVRDMMLRMEPTIRRNVQRDDLRVPDDFRTGVIQILDDLQHPQRRYSALAKLTQAFRKAMDVDPNSPGIFQGGKYDFNKVFFDKDDYLGRGFTEGYKERSFDDLEPGDFMSFDGPADDFYDPFKKVDLGDLDDEIPFEEGIDEMMPGGKVQDPTRFQAALQAIKEGKRVPDEVFAQYSPSEGGGRMFADLESAVKQGQTFELEDGSIVGAREAFALEAAKGEDADFTGLISQMRRNMASSNEVNPAYFKLDHVAQEMGMESLQQQVFKEVFGEMGKFLKPERLSNEEVFEVVNYMRGMQHEFNDAGGVDEAIRKVLAGDRMDIPKMKEVESFGQVREVEVEPSPREGRDYHPFFDMIEDSLAKKAEAVSPEMTEARNQIKFALDNYRKLRRFPGQKDQRFNQFYNDLRKHAEAGGISQKEFVELGHFINKARGKKVQERLGEFLKYSEDHPDRHNFLLDYMDENPEWRSSLRKGDDRLDYEEIDVGSGRIPQEGTMSQEDMLSDWMMGRNPSSSLKMNKEQRQAFLEELENLDRLRGVLQLRNHPDEFRKRLDILTRQTGAAPHPDYNKVAHDFIDRARWREIIDHVEENFGRKLEEGGHKTFNLEDQLRKAIKSFGHVKDLKTGEFLRRYNLENLHKTRGQIPEDAAYDSNVAYQAILDNPMVDSDIKQLVRKGDITSTISVRDDFQGDGPVIPGMESSSQLEELLQHVHLRRMLQNRTKSIVTPEQVFSVIKGLSDDLAEQNEDLIFKYLRMMDDEYKKMRTPREGKPTFNPEAYAPDFVRKQARKKVIERENLIGDLPDLDFELWNEAKALARHRNENYTKLQRRLEHLESMEAVESSSSSGAGGPSPVRSQIDPASEKILHELRALTADWFPEEVADTGVDSDNRIWAKLFNTPEKPTIAGKVNYDFPDHASKSMERQRQATGQGPVTEKQLRDREEFLRKTVPPETYQVDFGSFDGASSEEILEELRKAYPDASGRARNEKEDLAAKTGKVEESPKKDTGEHWKRRSEIAEIKQEIAKLEKELSFDDIISIRESLKKKRYRDRRISRWSSYRPEAKQDISGEPAYDPRVKMKEANLEDLPDVAHKSTPMSVEFSPEELKKFEAREKRLTRIERAKGRRDRGKRFRDLRGQLESFKKEQKRSKSKKDPEMVKIWGDYIKSVQKSIEKLRLEGDWEPDLDVFIRGAKKARKANPRNLVTTWDEMVMSDFKDNFDTILKYIDKVYPEQTGKKRKEIANYYSQRFGPFNRLPE